MNGFAYVWAFGRRKWWNTDRTWSRVVAYRAGEMFVLGRDEYIHHTVPAGYCWVM